MILAFGGGGHQLSIRDLTPLKSFIWVFGEQAGVGSRTNGAISLLCCGGGGAEVQMQ